MPTDRYTKPVHVVEVDVIDRASLTVGHDDHPTDQFLLGDLQFAEDVYGSSLASAGPVHARENSWGCRMFKRAMHLSGATHSDAGNPTSMPRRIQL